MALVVPKVIEPADKHSPRQISTAARNSAMMAQAKGAAWAAPAVDLAVVAQAEPTVDHRVVRRVDQA